MYDACVDPEEINLLVTGLLVFVAAGLPTTDEPCESCGARPAWDFMGDVLCAECAGLS